MNVLNATELYTKMWSQWQISCNVCYHNLKNNLQLQYCNILRKVG